jgi:hypothetical protein
MSPMAPKDGATPIPDTEPHDDLLDPPPPFPELEDDDAEADGSKKLLSTRMDVDEVEKEDKVDWSVNDDTEVPSSTGGDEKSQKLQTELPQGGEMERLQAEIARLRRSLAAANNATMKANQKLVKYGERLAAYSVLKERMGWLEDQHRRDTEHVS